ncbi:flippase [Photobacterium damselae]|uniref:flippase n=1 Tax=Gammaproteobacteria TaxID=1236 RepID=UPI00223E6682|nr:MULTISPECIES: flippase [Gammaproteobacteria]MCG3813616.1 flippase [Photobacterium damselae]MCG3880494.1 flippase [Psychrobacter sp. Ps6]
MSLDKVIRNNIASLFSIRIASYVIPLITMPYLVKTLNPKGYGELMFGIAILQYLILIVNYGFDLSATKKVAQNNKDKEYISKIFFSILVIRMFFFLILIAILTIFISCVKELEDIKSVLQFGYLSVLGVALFPQWIFQGKEQLGVISIARVIVQVLSIPLFFLLVKNQSDAYMASLIYSLPQISIAFISFYLIFKRGWVKKVKISILDLIVELKDGWHLFMSTAAISLYTTTVTVVLGFVSGPFSVAIYSSANKLIQAAQGLYQPISNAYYPRINNQMKKDRSLAFKTIRKLMKFQFILTLCISVCVFVFSPIVVDILFGVKYSDSVVVLRILSIIPVIVGLSNIFGVQTLLTCGYKKDFSKILMYSGVVNLILIVPACYYFSYMGAAVTVVITEVFVTFRMFLFIKKHQIPLFG